MMKTDKKKPEKIPSKRDRVAKKKTRDSKRTIVTGSIDVATEGQAVVHDIDEASKRCVKTARRLIKAEEELKVERKRCRLGVESCGVVLKESIEMPCDGSEELASWRKAVVNAWQESEEAIAGMDAVCDPLAADVKALKKALREQITNIDQLGLRF